MRVIVFLAVCIAAVAALPKYGLEYVPERIVGGSVTTIANYPSIGAVLFSSNGVTFSLFCGCSILNSRSFLTAAHCTIGRETSNFRIRVGSTNANSGGVIYHPVSLINHGSYNPNTHNNDISIIRSARFISSNYFVQATSIPSANYNLGDNQVVRAVGWGAISPGGPFSEQLRFVQIWTVNQEICAQRYATIGISITNNMLCSGWLDVGGRDQCQGDSGGPLLHNRVTVGVSSFGQGCGLAFFPSVNVRVSQYTDWIQSNS